MSGLKPLRTEFGIHLRLESCGYLLLPFFLRWILKDLNLLPAKAQKDFVQFCVGQNTKNTEVEELATKHLDAFRAGIS